MIKAECGCFIMTGVPYPIIHLECDEHVGSEVYGNYDGKVDEVCDILMELFLK